MPKLAANLTMMFTEVDFLSRFKKAKDAGFKGVEYLLPYDYSVEEVVNALQSNGLTQVLFNLPSGDMPNGERGIACLPDRIDEFRNGVDEAITYAKALNCSQLNCLAGRLPEEGLSVSEAHGVFIDNLRFAAQKLDAENIVLLIEMINTKDVPAFFLNTTAQALEILEEVNHPNLKIQYDIYHMQKMEGELALTMEANIDNIKHMQLWIIPVVTSRVQAKSITPSCSSLLISCPMKAGSVVNTHRPQAPKRDWDGLRTTFKSNCRHARINVLTNTIKRISI